jgi:hypothetical protein
MTIDELVPGRPTGRLTLDHALLNPIPTTLKAEGFRRLVSTRAVDLACAVGRVDVLDPYLVGRLRPGEGPLPTRTAYRWLRNWKVAGWRYGWGFIGLLPEPEKRSRVSQFPEEVRRFATAVGKQYRREPWSTRGGAYRRLVAWCTDSGHPAPSYATFVVWMRQDEKALSCPRRDRRQPVRTSKNQQAVRRRTPGPSARELRA